MHLGVCLHDAISPQSLESLAIFELISGSRRKKFALIVDTGEIFHLS